MLALLPGAVAAQSKTLDAAQLVALVKATPQLKIDSKVTSSAYDPKTHPYVEIVGAPEGQSIGGFLLSDRARDGMLAGGGEVVVVPLDSGGSGGIFTQVVFARTGAHAFAYAGHLDSGGHLDVRIARGVIVAALPYYGPHDPNCCPSQRIEQTYTIRNGKLFKLSEKRFALPRSE